MKVFWTVGALEARQEIIRYIEADNPLAAITMEKVFIEAARKLEQFPGLGHIGPISGTREVLAHNRYRMIYEVDETKQAVYILALIHTARQWPSVPI